MKNTKFLTKNINNTAVLLLKRTAVFLAIFIIFSGILGPHIISHGLVSKDGFEIYGGAGKALLFAVIAFAILVWRKKKQIKLKSWSFSSVIWLVLSIITFIASYLSVNQLITGHQNFSWIILSNVLLITSVIFALGASFGPSNIRTLFNHYFKEILLSILIAIGFYLLLIGVYASWSILATVVLHSVRWLLAITGLSVTVLPPRTLLLTKFGINIAKYCSGIESIALFSGLYVFIGLLDWRRFKHSRYLEIFIPALLILFALNILRVYVLIVGGYYINPQIAFSLFHTYAAMIFFIIYSGIFWKVSYKWMLKEIIK